MTGTFEIYKAGRGKYRFRYRASTGEIVATSTAYPTKAEARKAMQAVLCVADGPAHADGPSRGHRWGRPRLG